MSKIRCVTAELSDAGRDRFNSAPPSWMDRRA
jgi:hypothetical protein